MAESHDTALVVILRLRSDSYLRVRTVIPSSSLRRLPPCGTPQWLISVVSKSVRFCQSVVSSLVGMALLLTEVPAGAFAIVGVEHWRQHKARHVVSS